MHQHKNWYDNRGRSDPGALSYAETFIIRGLNDLPLRFRRRS